MPKGNAANKPRTDVVADVSGVVATITELVLSEILSLRRFCTLIDEERKALTGHKADSLPAIVDEKSRLAMHLSNLEAQRDQALHAAGLATGREGMESWLQICSNADTEKAQWEVLLDLASYARRENETNGRLINLLLKQNQDALAVLLSSGGGSIYGPDGQQRTLSGKRSFGSA